jgi:hypothetical protein
LDTAIAEILGTKIPTSKIGANTLPILSRTAIEKKLDTQKSEEKARKKLIAENKLDLSKEHASPYDGNPSYEKQLRKVATRGGMLHCNTFFQLT